MPSLPAYYPSNGATITIDAGVWSASTRPTVRVTVTLDARLLIDFVNVAANNTNAAYTIGLGTPPATLTLT